MVAFFGALAAAAVGLLTLLYRIFTERRHRRSECLKDLQTKFDNLPKSIRGAVTLAGDHKDPDDTSDFDQLAAFLTRLADRREAGEVRLSEIDSRFGEWFFRTLHSPVGVKVVREAKSFGKLKNLYPAWYRYRLRHKKRIESTDTFAAQRWAVHTRAHTNTGRILWHHRLHENGGGGARLIFWRLRFGPSYNSREILDFIETVCEDFDVDSYVVYELLGPHDLLLRCWLPDADITERGSSRIEQMNKDFEGRPEGATERCDYFRVEHVRRHWWWREKRLWWRRGRELTLDDSAVANWQTCEDEATVSQLVDQYNAAKIGLPGVLLNRAVHKYRKKNYIRWRPLRDGIKFATIIRVKDDTAGYEKARQHIENLVDAASSIGDRSLYEGSGFGEESGPAHFLILGRVRPRKFEKIRAQIIEPVVATPAIVDHCTPTLTYVMTGPAIMRRTYKDRVKHVGARAEALVETQTV